MAVQAQYPSNVLFPNRNVQDGLDLDCSLQPQIGVGGGFLDQTHMLFSNGESISTRKRGREASSATNMAASANFQLPFQQNPQQPLQLIDLSQLHNNQNGVVSTGLRLSFIDQQKKQQQSLLRNSYPTSSNDFAAQIKQHRVEIDQLLRTQGEQLRRTLAEKRQRHYRSLIGAAEEAVVLRLREKEAEVEKVTRRNAALEARAAQLSREAQVWQAKARAQENTATALQAQLQQAVVAGGGQDRRAAAEEGEAQAEDAESAYIDPDRVEVVGPSCKACRRRVATVVLLPCRHLSVCSDCDGAAAVLTCPVCFCSRNSSVEVYL